MTEKAAQRRLAAIAVADVVGYSRLMEADEAGTLAVLKQRRKEIVEPTVHAHGGRIVKVMGDGVLIEFASAVNAVKGTLELQSKMAVANADLPQTQRIVLRIGINLGDVIGEGSDIYGDGINIAARLEALAEPGNVVVSATVYDHVSGKLALAFDDLGERMLKNIVKPVRVYRVGSDETGEHRSQPALALPDKPSIAVLPFQNMSGDVEQEYFADGIVDEITTALSRFSSLFVIAGNSSFAYKGRAVDVKQIGRELGVRYLLEGSVRKAGNRMRITGQLIDVSTAAHIWADRFEGRLEDVFDLQDQITASVVGAIVPKLDQAEIERSRRKPTQSLDAYDYYLRGIAAVHLSTREASMTALSMFNRATELDPNFAVAYGMAGRCYSQRKFNGWNRETYAEEKAEAERVARRAIALGGDDAVALSTAGHALSYVAGDEEGVTAIERAIALNPNLAWAWLFGGWAKIRTGEFEASIERVTRAMRLSPNDPHVFSMQTAMATAHFGAERYAEALAWAERAMSHREGLMQAMLIATAGAALIGETAKSTKLLERLRVTDPALRMANLDDYRLPLREDRLSKQMERGLRKAGLPE